VNVALPNMSSVQAATSGIRLLAARQAQVGVVAQGAGGTVQEWEPQPSSEGTSTTHTEPTVQFR
jgi:hypothetical protein